MNELRTFLSDNLTGFSIKSIPGFLFSFLVCAVLSFLLSKVYIRYGNSLSNRRAFSRNFILLAITTMFIISVVKSSLALSLGLVGALSIVRFRSAIKEPEELTYLFLTIAIGLGCGAGLAILTMIAFVGFVLIIWAYSSYHKEVENQHLYLTISANQQIDLKAVVAELQKYCTGLKLKRTDESAESTEAAFYVAFETFDQLQDAKSHLKSMYPAVTITFMDSSRDF